MTHPYDTEIMKTITGIYIDALGQVINTLHVVIATHLLQHVFITYAELCQSVNILCRFGTWKTSCCGLVPEYGFGPYKVLQASLVFLL